MTIAARAGGPAFGPYARAASGPTTGRFHKGGREYLEIRIRRGLQESPRTFVSLSRERPAATGPHVVAAVGPHV